MIRSPRLTLAALLIIAAHAADAQGVPATQGDLLTLPQPFSETPEGTKTPPVPPSEGAALPASPSDAPGPMPIPIDLAEIASLRAAYDDLRRREADAVSLNQPVAAETLADMDAVTERAEGLDATLSRLAWKAESLDWFAKDIRQYGALALPDGTPANMTTAFALTKVEQGTFYYDTGPPFSNQTLKGTFAEPSVVLRVAEAPGIQLVWVPGQGFAFMSGQSLEIYK
ncbi:hypothetical protein ACSSV8_003710 [Roseovarius sp. MBR-79]|jgi:hypothetical protein